MNEQWCICCRIEISAYVGYLSEYCSPPAKGRIILEASAKRQPPTQPPTTQAVSMAMLTMCAYKVMNCRGKSFTLKFQCNVYQRSLHMTAPHSFRSGPIVKKQPMEMCDVRQGAGNGGTSSPIDHFVCSR